MKAAELVRDVKQLVAMPEVCLRVNQMINSSSYSASDIGEVLAQDTDLSARLLKVVNSALYGLPAPVETISRAVTVIGTRDLRDLAVTTFAHKLFQGIPYDLMNVAEFWQYSVSTGVYARALARHCHVLHSERLFVMGVLHDLGRLVIFKHLPDAARDILLIADTEDDLLVAAERDILGFDHTEVGYELMSLWGLPESLCNTARFHHSPGEAVGSQLESALVHIASTLASGDKWGRDLEDTLSRVQPVAWEISGLDPLIVEDIQDEAMEEVSEMAASLFSTGAAARQPASN